METLKWLLDGVRIVVDWWQECWLPPYGSRRSPSKPDLYFKMVQERQRAEERRS